MASLGRKLKEILNRDGLTRSANATDMISARLIKGLGFEVVGAGGNIASTSRVGCNDANLITLTEVTEWVRNLVETTELPVFVDVDSGYGHGGPLNLIRTTRELEAAGAAGIHFEDLRGPKQLTGWRPTGTDRGFKGELRPLKEAVTNIRAAVENRRDADFVIMGRTDFGWGTAGLNEALDRGSAYIEAGAHAIVIERTVNVNDDRQVAEGLEDLKAFAQAFRSPVLISSSYYHNPKLAEMSTTEIHKLGFRGIHMGSQIAPLVAARAVEDALKVWLATDGKVASVRDRMMSVDEFTSRATNLSEILAWEKKYVVPYQPKTE